MSGGLHESSSAFDLGRAEELKREGGVVVAVRGRG